MIKKVLSAFLSLFFLAAFAHAQSGRRINPAPTPTPVALPESAPRSEGGYSESRPARTRSVRSEAPRNSSSTKPRQPKPDNTPVVLDGTEDSVLTVETNLVTIPVSVFDRNGLYIPNLSEDDFKIFEDGKEQDIAYFGTSEKPFTVVLLLDTSPSTEFKIEDIQRAAIAFVDKLKPQDNVMVIEFDGNVHVLTEATSDRERIYKAIRKADFGGGTSLYEAVEFSLKKRLNKIEGRKAIVLFTDGVDTTSFSADYDSSLRLAEESDALIFPIYYNTYFDNRRGGGVTSPWPFPGGGRVISRGTTAREYALGREYLNDLSAVTGGRVFRAESSVTSLEDAFEGIAEELCRQYTLGYYPDESGSAGQRKSIKVRVNRPNLVVRARDSYIVGGLPADKSGPTKK